MNLFAEMVRYGVPLEVSALRRASSLVSLSWGNSPALNTEYRIRYNVRNLQSVENIPEYDHLADMDGHALLIHTGCRNPAKLTCLLVFSVNGQSTQSEFPTVACSMLMLGVFQALTKSGLAAYRFRWLADSKASAAPKL